MPLKPRKRRVSFQSTHSLWSATDGTGRPGSIVRSFNPRTPCGVRPRAAISSFSCLRFQSTHSLWSATHLSVRLQVFRMVSIHALLVECDRARASMAGSSFGFNPRTPCGVRPERQPFMNRYFIRFQSTHSLWSATAADGGRNRRISGFNPRTPCGVRPLFPPKINHAIMFQSTHSLWSATVGIDFLRAVCAVSIHALLVECDRMRDLIARMADVSIHALLVECDNPLCRGRSGRDGFNPRTPCGVRLARQTNEKPAQEVSIHALLVECDRFSRFPRAQYHCFNPRTPCGVRLLLQEGYSLPLMFQSTHSLWSATFIRHQ